MLRGKKLKWLAIAIPLIVVAVITAWVISSNNQQPGQKELSEVKSQISKLMLLPTDEEPTLAVVEDKAKLTDPYLHEKALDGDQILIYAKNQIVIVYRPSINKIAAVGTIDADPATPEAQDATVTVLNGSNDSDKTKQVIEKIKAAYPELKVADGGKTNRQDFTTTIVIDNSNSKDNLVDALSEAIPAKRGIVPISEAKTESDIQVIVGKD